MDKKIVTKLQITFDGMAHKDEDADIDFWYARELQIALGYTKWDNFLKVIEKAKIACQTAGSIIAHHFADVGKTIQMPKTAVKEILDIKLTRYACYLIAQNGDPRKDEIAFAQSYFAIQTRKQELVEERINLLKRLAARDKLRKSETQLSRNIYERGVDDKGFARIRSCGDAALFGKSTQAMKQQLAVKGNRPLADFLPTLTIAAKNLATEMTNYNTEEKDLQGERSITAEHVHNNRAVRGMLGQRGIKPENLPPAEDIKKVESRVASDEKKIAKKNSFKSDK